MYTHARFKMLPETSALVSCPRNFCTLDANPATQPRDQIPSLVLASFAAPTKLTTVPKSGTLRKPGTSNLRLKCHLRPQCISIRSEEHTSELQSLTNLVCRLLLEKKKKTTQSID